MISIHLLETFTIILHNKKCPQTIRTHTIQSVGDHLSYSILTCNDSIHFYHYAGFSFFFNIIFMTGVIKINHMPQWFDVLLTALNGELLQTKN